MELQTLASSLASAFLKGFFRWQQRLSSALPFLCIEDFILIATLLGATPDTHSLWIGGGMSLLAMSLLFWVQGYQKAGSELNVVGPFRFVRHPLRLSLWILAIAFSLGSRSFPGLLISLGLLPYLYHLDMHREELIRRNQTLAAFRYAKFVPALVPTIFPYKQDKRAQTQAFSWRMGLFSIERSIRRRLGRLAFGWVVIALIARDLLPGVSAWIAAGVWLVFLIIRTVMHRKTVLVVFN